MWKTLSVLQRNLVWTIPVSMAFGLVFGYLFDTTPLKRFIIPVCPLATENIMVKIGDPAEQIVRSANDGSYDMVIMGTHGHSRLDDMMLGSVARDVVHNSTVPVLTVRLTDEKNDA